jgi:hypothetical protein
MIAPDDAVYEKKRHTVKDSRSREIKNDNMLVRFRIRDS